MLIILYCLIVVIVFKLKVRVIMNNNVMGLLSKLANVANNGQIQGGQPQDGQQKAITPNGINPQDVRNRFARRNIGSSLIGGGQPKQTLRKPVPVKPARNNAAVGIPAQNFKGMY